MKELIKLLSFSLIFNLLISCNKTPVSAAVASAPDVPAPLNRSASDVIVKLETKEVIKQLAPGVDYTFWTFGGNVPGPFLRLKEGDNVEFQLSNHPSSKMPHNIDLHAVMGPGGGAGASFTAPGHTSVFKFKALRAGLYVYHCATAPVGMHIANGMYGLVFVEPPDGLPKVDKEYYIMQSEFYTKGKTGERGLQPFDMEKALKEQPDYIVFNGKVGANTDDKAIKVRKGEKVRLFVGNAGPNLASSFHIIGQIFDSVFPEASMGSLAKNIQTTLIPAGGASIVEFEAKVPGTYILVDHSIFRAFNKGALAHLKVEGDAEEQIFSGKISDLVYLPEGGAAQSMGDLQKPSLGTLQQKMEQGKNIFEQNCAACHQINARGIQGVFPPLANSDFLNADKLRAAKIVKKGFSGQIKVNGDIYNGTMPALGLGDEAIANVLTYLLNSFNNKGGMVTPEEVSRIK
ncbi:nitrite reductase, copper-dependent [Leptospira fainei serovar Hurstbridge str. BUT 6]|uniref:Copper-containing nitrite reductase n=1 Tax=Leptospira fainei serovar Hurstbridge str. BUT 6 TaxID=1193011 RepID=S3V0Y4_9LEPT|nr:copper-containing nitrite reductase [Leptospira fainei]EPG76351.1 nitrite reductase, copper-dependent [Leptospira fainei serovar Hurstbridge str. BUT 6]